MTSLACTKTPEAPLHVGSIAPDIQGQDVDGKNVKLSELKGKTSVVYFYPKDDTPGCTKEACAFRDKFNEYSQRGVSVFGVSRDAPESHANFRSKYHLPFILVSDTNGDISRAYGVLGMTGMAKRVTFLVGPDGKVERVWPNVDPGVHAEEVLAVIRP